MDRRKFVLRGLGAVAGAGLAAGLLGACGGGDSATGPDGGGTNGGTDGGSDGGDDTFDGTIVLTSALTFDPADVTIQAGETITWENGSGVDHTITPDGHDEWSRQVVTEDGETFQHTFGEAGTYPYYCEFHGSPGSGMHGTITVE